MRIAQRYRVALHNRDHCKPQVRGNILEIYGLARNGDYLFGAILPHPAIDQDVVEVAVLRRAGF